MLQASYFDGQTSRRHAVTLGLQYGEWLLSGEQLQRRVPVAEASLSEKIGKAPRQLHFDDGAYCLIADHAALESMLQAAGMQPHSTVSRLEGKWRYALASFVLIAVFFAAAYQWGLPWAANVVAQRLPASLPALMDEQTMAMLDQYVLEPSELPPARQQEITQALSGLQPAQGGAMPEFRLVFRKSEAIGPNAFAMPGGTILLTDELVHLADNSQQGSAQARAQILGVLAHEIGHVEHRHALRQFVQGTIVAAVVTWYLGDVSSLLAAAPAALLNTRYTRNFEREADAYAAATMLKNGLSPAALADMLSNMEQHYRQQEDVADEESETAETQWLDYFSTHPNTQERIARLRGQSGKEARP
ncbi:MAG: peptidase M48 [Betaproteobacteria bacterium HGW-Betaproteobacteria-1]|jgi:Zn-dependent protease with chaperone function|nr:MAG: peptidase M48 [Betaproteobacteria bacterium HGW-Betaproteobacteria-1]